MPAPVFFYFVALMAGKCFHELDGVTNDFDFYEFITEGVDENLLQNAE